MDQKEIVWLSVILDSMPCVGQWIKIIYPLTQSDES